MAVSVSDPQIQRRSRKLEFIVWAALAICVASIAGAFIYSKRQPRLPSLNRVTDFTLTNQAKGTVSLSDLRGKVWVADIIFTRCAGPCAKMTRQFSALQNVLSNESGVHLVSLTADPEYDTPEVLTRYGEKFNADQKRWTFLTGTKKDLYRLAMDGLLLALEEKTPESRENENDLFIHSTRFVLIDKQGVMRAAYDSTEPGTNEKIVADVQKLLRE